MEVRIVGTDLPGTRCDDGRNPAYENVHVGVQCRKDVVDMVPGDASRATWDLSVDVVTGDDLDFRGPYVHGKRGDRFLYLSWGTVDGAGTFEMFRRAKLLLSPIDPAVVSEAAGEGRTLVGSIRLTDSCGLPRCASVKPDAMEWSAA